MSGIEGIDTRKPDRTLCLVTDCGKKGLYRSARSKAGYCSIHKHLAVARVVADGDSHRAWFDTREDLPE